MENNKKFEFKPDDIAVMEHKLVKPLRILHESPKIHTIKGNIREFVIQYCLDNGLPLIDTVEKANEILNGDFCLRMQDIVPESKKGQEYLVKGTFFSILNKEGVIWDEKKTDEMLTSICELTGVSKDMAAPMINTLIKQRKRNVIEKDVFEFLRDRVSGLENPKDRKAISNEVITAFAEHLSVEPSYIKGVLKNKKKKDAAEEQRVAAYRAKKAEEGQSQGGTNLDDNDDDAR